MRKRNALIGVVVVVVLAGVGFPMWIQSQWDSAVEMTDVLRARIESSGGKRPVIWGTGESGSAWEGYRAAVAGVKSLDIEPGEVPSATRRECGADGAEKRTGRSIEELLESSAPLLALLRVGAHRDQARYPMKWNEGSDHQTQELFSTKELSNLAMLSAWRSVREGREVDAAHTLLDAMQLGGDLMRAPLLINEIIGGAILSIPMDALLGRWSPSLLMQLSPEALEFLAQGLTTLDRSLPLGGQAIAGEIVLLTRLLESASTNDIGLGRLDLWRYGFSARLAAAKYAHAVTRLESRYQELTGREGCVDLKALTALFREAKESSNPISRLVLPHLWSMTSVRLQAIARLRLVRMAVDHALGRPIQVLPDPAGGMLHAELQKTGAVNLSSDQHDCLSVTLDAPASRSTK